MHMTTVERNDIFDLAFRFVTETQESIFLTGKAGTGKTTFLKYLRQHSCKNMVVAAPTGVAAINAGGVTLHSLFQLPLHPFLPTAGNRLQLLQGLRYNKQRMQLLRKIELLVIDEISMVRCDVMDAIDTILKSVRRNPDAPFGGVQLLYIGDLFQLPPVAKNNEWQLLSEYYASPFFFDSKAVKEQSPLLIELKTIYRQKEQNFVNLLNKVRNNQLEAEDFDYLNSRYMQPFGIGTAEQYITLTSHNNQADAINQQQLQQLLAPAFTYKARVEDDFPENIYPADAALVLKQGTQVMFIKNDVVGKKYFNGKIAVITALSDEAITVACDGENITVTQDVWENTRYTLNRSDEKLEQQVVGRFHQYPLRLAWAITIHKSQGLTFDNVKIDAATAFSSGQVYVALSRCTSLDGIVLLSKIPATAIYSNQQVVDAHHTLLPKASLEERFEGARQLFTLQLLSEIFLMNHLMQQVGWLNQMVEKHAEKLNPDAWQWVQQQTQQLLKEKTFAEKFIDRIPSLLQQQPVIENNTALQKRIQDAVNYFLPLLQQFKTQLQQHTLLTESKETAAAIDEVLQELMTGFVTTIHLMQYCVQPFTVAGFLQHKLNLAIPRVHISSYAASKKQSAEAGMPNAELYYALRNWRDKVCNEQNLPIYFVANTASLKDISTCLPQTKTQLQDINGFGKTKAEKYGDEIIGIVQDYCNRYHIETNMELTSSRTKKQSKKTTEKKAEKIPSYTLTLQLYQQGKSIAAIAAERNLSQGTIEGHLADLVKTGQVSISAFADETSLNIIAQQLTDNPEARHTDIRTLLNNAYSFVQIKAVANHLHFLQNPPAHTAIAVQQ
jgi:hypothetical protein